MKDRRQTSFNAMRLRNEFPELAEAFEKVLNERRDIYPSAHTNYNGKYTGRAKGLSLGLIVEILEENGIKVNINIS